MKIKQLINELFFFRYKKEFYPYIIISIVLFLFMLFVFFNFLNDHFFLLSSGTTAQLIVLILLIIGFSCIILYAYFKVFFKIILKIAQELKKAEESDGESIAGTSTSFMNNISAIINRLGHSKQREASLLLLQKEAEISAMQSKINPHFLYNTLDCIRGTALMENAQDTADILEALSVFFRYTISQTNRLLTVEQELRNVNTYIKIQQYRFQDLFTMDTIVDCKEDAAMSCKIPKLTLQPLIENAIVHGFSSTTEGGKIIIHFSATQSRLLISIFDNGIGIPSDRLRKINTMLHDNSVLNNQNEIPADIGTALYNVNTRIKLMFGEKYGLSLLSTQGFGTEVQVVLPLPKSENEV